MWSSLFASPRDEHRPEGSQLLWAVYGSATDHGPPDIHVHRGVEVGILTAGREDLHFSDAVVECGPGDVWLCNVFEPHGATVRIAPRQSVVLIFVPEFIGEEMVGELPWLALFAVPPHQRPRVTSSRMRDRALGIAHALRREIEGKLPYWEDLVRLQVLHLLTELRREWDAAEIPDAAAHVRLSALARVMPALSLIHSVPWRRVAAGEAAGACRLSVSRFHSLFGRTMGMSFGRFGMRARLSFAAHRVLNTDRPFSVIAAESGFTDRSHLYRRFAQQYGCTPAQYRARARSIIAKGLATRASSEGRARAAHLPAGPVRANL